MTELPIADLHVRFSMNKMLGELGGMTDAEFKDGFKHLASVAAQNDDLVALELIANALGAPTDAPLPPKIQRAMQMLLVEAMGVGKEITLRKLCKLFDPHGEWLDVPKDWIGNGPG